jgi:beta-xylosidase
MRKSSFGSIIFVAILLNVTILSQAQLAQNPVIFADVPDISIVRVGNSYYMSSTTMHMAPGVPIMKSKDLINWEIVNYAYNINDTIK